MLDDPEKQVWLDTDTRVLTSNTRLAQSQCREIAEKNELRGEGRCTYKGVAKSKNGRSHVCIFEREID